MIRVLIADDDRDFLSEISSSLESMGFEVVLAQDGDEAFRKAREMMPDAVLLDIKMGGLSGFQVADKLTGNPATRKIPVLAMTGVFSRSADTDLFRVCGFRDRLVKPFSPEAAAVKIRRAVRDSRRGISRTALA